MGYRTVLNVPRTANHAEAKRIHDNIKPIRGKTVRPLGERRDYHQYSVYEAEDGTIVYVCYKTPVVKFYTDGRIGIQNGGWSTTSTHEFLRRVLALDASGYMGKTAVTFPSGDKYMLDGGEELVLHRDKSNRLAPMKELPQYPALRMNRTAANNVRRRYKDFSEYMHNMIKLRTEKTVHTPAYGSAYETEGILFPKAELEQVLGLTTMTHAVKPAFSIAAICVDPSKHSRYVIPDMDKAPEQAEAFLALIDPEQPEDNKHANYYKAFVALAVGPRQMWSIGSRDGSLYASAENIRYTYNLALMRSCAEEVLQITMLAPGALPTRAYQGWIKKEN